jgi:CheY-like chemotaxis protein
MAITGYTHLAKEQLSSEDPALRDLDEILTAGDRAKKLINQILTFSRQSEAERRPTNIQVILSETLNLLRASIPKTIAVRKKIDDEAKPVLADATSIHQLIMNLCTNAYQAMEGKHGTLTVSLSQEILDVDEDVTTHPDMKSGTYVKLTVQDTGHGMTQDVLEHIFEPYFTTKERGQGTGMGLATCLGIVTGHGGFFIVDSEPEKGSSFHVYLPTCDEEVEKEATEKVTETVGAARIMFVDDEDQIREIGKRLLESKGYQVEVFTGSVEALVTFRDRPGDFDLVITDLTMPTMTGLELAKELMIVRRDIPVILCTGYSEDHTAEKLKEMGIRGFLKKPWVPGALTDKVAKILSGKFQA